MSPPEGDWFDRVPKVELHLHLEGAIPLGTLWELIQKYGGDPSVPTPEALSGRFRYRDFPHFIETWVWKGGFLRDYGDLERIAEAVARDLLRQNIRYAEAFYSPGDFRRKGLTVQEITRALRRGLARVPGVEVALVADLVRDLGPAHADACLDALGEVLDQGVIGIGLGGSEPDFPPEPFAPAYARARGMGLRTTAHAGEAAGPESVWGALRALKAERIGHGTRAVEDPALMDHLAEHRIPLEVCPLSNLRTRVVRSAREHPVRHLVERGIPVSIATDDPAMFGNSLAGEYRLLEAECGFTRDGIRELILQGIRTSWLPPERKRAMLASFVADPAWSPRSPVASPAS